jgi:hypothetical protein
MSKRVLPTQAELKAVVHYDPQSGVFTWLHRPGDSNGDKIFNGRNAGYQAGSINVFGFRTLLINGVQHPAGRLAFVYMGEPIPTDHTIHRKDKNPSNDRWDNLYSATRGTAALAVTKATSRSKSGVRGVSWNARSDRWCAQVRVDGKQVNRYFTSLRLATKWREAEVAKMRAGVPS